MERTLDNVQAILAEAGFDAEIKTESVIWARDPDSGVAVTCVLQDDILFNTLTCFTIPDCDITSEMKDKMLDSQNGISTSAFQIYKIGDGKVAVTLNNFAKLQELENDDKDDILSCINFLLADAFEARDLLDVPEASESEDDDSDDIEVEETEVEIDDDGPEESPEPEPVAEVADSGGYDSGGDSGGDSGE